MGQGKRKVREDLSLHRGAVERGVLSQRSEHLPYGASMGVRVAIWGGELSQRREHLPYMGREAPFGQVCGGELPYRASVGGVRTSRHGVVRRRAATHAMRGGDACN